MKKRKWFGKMIATALVAAIIANGGNIATLSFSAPKGAVSKSITSSHSASYNGAKGKDTTAASR